MNAKVVFYLILLLIDDHGTMSVMKFVGAIDEGTSSARFIIFKAGTNEIVCYHQLDVPSEYPQEGWVEQDPELIYDTVLLCIEESVKKFKSLGYRPEVNNDTPIQILFFYT